MNTKNYHDTLATEFFQKGDVKIDKIEMPSKDILYNLEDYTSARS